MAPQTSERELLECLITAAGGGSDEAHRLHSYFGSLRSALAASPGALARAAGAEGVAATLLPAARAVWLHCLQTDVADRPVLSDGAALVAYLRAQLGAAAVEEFRVLYLDTRNGLICDRSVGTGTVSEVAVYPRDVVASALDVGASGLILVHNHPSRDTKPSGADLELTRGIVAAAKPFDLTIYDHIIVGGDTLLSFRTAGLL